MHLLFTPHHVQLLNACYPPTSALVTAGPGYSPSAHELSRLTYHASNHPGKLARLGAEIEKRIQYESRKAKAGNLRTRASLLISLAILRSLATECRRDIALISPHLISCVQISLAALPKDLEVVARVASVFTAWTTYTNGNLIGADNSLTSNYLSILQQFADLGSSAAKDEETRNRTRLIGFAAITSAVNSEALYNDSSQFRAHVMILLRPILLSIFETPIEILEKQSTTAQNAPNSPYLAEFRTRPALERRAASIHLHVDGDKGPSLSDVSDAALRALFSLLNHAGGAQLGSIMQSSFENLDRIRGWEDISHCRWYAMKVVEWAQYQYRFVPPTWLVDKLKENQETTVTPLHLALASMVSSVFRAPTPLINLSSADLMSHLLSLLLRRTAIAPADPLIPSIVECISSLGCHLYYSDQIRDLAEEIVSRITMVEMQGSTASNGISQQNRSSALCNLMASLMGLIRVANEYEEGRLNDSTKANTSQTDDPSVPRIEVPKLEKPTLLVSRRTRVSPLIWQDTLSLICDPDPRVRVECANILTFYLVEEMPKIGEHLDGAGVARVPKVVEAPILQASNVNLFLSSGDTGSRFLNSLHAYAYILATNPIQMSGVHLEGPTEGSGGLEEKTTTAAGPPRRSESLSHKPRARKASQTQRLGRDKPILTAQPGGWVVDYANLLQILQVVQEQFPVRGLLTCVPMLTQLTVTIRAVVESSDNVKFLRTTVTKLWGIIGKNWDCVPLVDICSKALASERSQELDPTAFIHLLAGSANVQEALGISSSDIQQQLSRRWTPKLAFANFVDDKVQAYDAIMRGDNISPLLKISPALMQIENISLQSLARSTRGLGVSDLREALEGRAGMSNPALLGRPGSISTFDRRSSATGGDGMVNRMKRHGKGRDGESRGRQGDGDVRDVLSRLGIGKPGSKLLRAPFPNLQNNLTS